MDYHRIHKPNSQGAGFSPSKLRAILLGAEKRRDDPQPLDSRSTLRSEASEIAELEENRRVSAADEWKDVDIVSSSAFEFEKARPGPMPPFSKPAPSKWDDARKWILNPDTNRARKPSIPQTKRGGIQPATKIVLEVTDNLYSKKIEPREAKIENAVDWVPDSYPVADSCDKIAPFVDPTINLSRHESSTLHQAATNFVTPPSTVRAVSMRDMGTEMTPIVSQEPSRTGTPARATTPTLSPTSSRPSTPRRPAPSSDPMDSFDRNGDNSRGELSEKELRMKTRREIMMLGTQLGKKNIAAWASKEDEEKTVAMDQTMNNAIEARATAWEEAEKAKYLARFKREEIKIQAWEDHQKAIAEAEMREVEVKVETLKARAQDRQLRKLRSISHEAEEKRAAAEVKRNHQAATAAQQAEYIRRTGRIPPSFSCWSWCP